MVNTTLESEHNAPDPLKVKVRNGMITIHPHHVDFFQKLLDLPISTRIELLNITPLQMQNYIGSEKKRLREEVTLLLSKEWFWKDTGDPVEINEDTIPGATFTVNQMKSKQRSIEVLTLIIEFFTGENREVYDKSER